MTRGGVVSTAFDPACQLWFENQGLREPNQTKPFTDGSDSFTLAYSLQRQALILRFARAVCADERYILSLVSVLDRTIKDRYGLDEGELHPLIYPTPIAGANNEFIYVLLYDVAGNGVPPLKRIHEEWEEVLRAAQERMAHCRGADGNGCEAGRYHCVKSFAMHHHAFGVNKGIAQMFVAYLLGLGRFVPSVSKPPERGTSAHFDLELELRQGGESFIVTSTTHTYKSMEVGTNNERIVEVLLRAILAEWEIGMRSFKLRSKLSVSCRHC